MIIDTPISGKTTSADVRTFEKRFRGRPGMILVKAGGGAGLNWDGIAGDIAALHDERPIILVHGANAIRAEPRGAPRRPVRTVVSPSGISSVYTDRAKRSRSS